MARLRQICLALPEVTERISHGEPCWFVRDRKTRGHASTITTMGPITWRSGARRRPARRRSWSSLEPDRFFRPPYVGPPRLARACASTTTLTGPRSPLIVREAYRQVAPKKLVSLLDAGPGPDADAGPGPDADAGTD